MNEPIDPQRDPEDVYVEMANAIAAATQHEQLDRVAFSIAEMGLLAPWLIELGHRKRAELTAAMGPPSFDLRIQCVMEITFTYPDMEMPHTTTVGIPDPIAVAQAEFGSPEAIDGLRNELQAAGQTLVSVMFRDLDSGAIIVITEKEWNRP
jgi:hypothetical protein